MSNNEGHNNIRIPRTPLSPPQFAKLREEGKENVIWKWENNYLIITFNTEARITACTVRVPGPGPGSWWEQATTNTDP